jgi:hypothetical protein
MKGSEVGWNFFGPRGFGCAIIGWKVFRWDGCAIGENPQSMDVSRRDGINTGKGLVVNYFSSFRTEGLDPRSGYEIFYVADVFNRGITITKPFKERGSAPMSAA